MKIKMLRTVPGAIDDGLRVVPFFKDKIYESEEMEGLAEIFMGLEEPAAEEYVPTPEQAKAIEKRERKMMKDAPENKGAPELPQKKDIAIEYFDGMRAGQIREFAKKKGVDLADQAPNTSASKLAEVFVMRQNDAL